MNLGSNIHNAFTVVFQTLQNIEKLITKCKVELDTNKYYMPVNRFLRDSSDKYWQGWVYWSFILLFQRYEDGEVMENGWINGPVYAVEINVDSETCDEPKIYVAKMDFGDISDWLKGCSQSDHTLFYNAIHSEELYRAEDDDEIVRVAESEFEEKMENSFWGLKNLIRIEMNLVDVTQDNYKEKIFGAIEILSQKEIPE